MKRSDVKREGKKWVAENIITAEQLHNILARYEKRAPGFLLVLFAVLLTSLGVLIFVFSDWAQFPNIFRLIIMILFMFALYVTGDILYDKYSELFGISFIMLGYIFFGASILLTLMMYNVTLHGVWPFVIWGIVGLLLYLIYKHPYVYMLGLSVTIFAQVYSGISFSTFNWLIFTVFMLGYFYLALKHSSRLFSYMIAIGFALHFVVLTFSFEQQYYWFIVYFLIMYAAVEFAPQQTMKRAFMHVGLISIFTLKVFETFLLQDDSFIDKMEIQTLFFVVWFVVWGITFRRKWIRYSKEEMIHFILFIPFFYLPFSYVYIIISMFLFSVYLLIIGYQKEMEEKVVIGTFGFLVSTFTVYIQFAWDTINQSLFFLVGGVLLFLISFILERSRRSIAHKGGGEK